MMIAAAVLCAITSLGEVQWKSETERLFAALKFIGTIGNRGLECVRRNRAFVCTDTETTG